MKLHITYQELSEFVKAKADKIVELSYIDNTTVNVKYTHMQKVPLCNKYIPIQLNVKLKVEGYEKGNLYLSYNAGKGLDTIIAGLLALYPSLRNMNIVEIQDGQKVIVCLAELERVRDALDKINILDIGFDEDGANVTFSLLIPQGTTLPES